MQKVFARWYCTNRRTTKTLYGNSFGWNEANDLDSMLEELFLYYNIELKESRGPSERIELGQYVRDFVEDHWLLIKQEV